MTNFTKTLAVLLMGIITMPAAVFAENGLRTDLRVGAEAKGSGFMHERMEDRREGDEKMKGGMRVGLGLGNACSRMSGIEMKFDGLAKMWGANMDIKVDAKEDREENRDAYWNGTIKNVRGDWDTKRQAGYDKMLAAAKTDAERQAVIEFKADVEAAINTKRIAIDAWVGANKTTRDNWESSHRAVIEKAYTDFAAAIRAAIAEAKAACDAGTDESTVQAAFKADVEAARTELKADLETARKDDWVRTKRDSLQKIMDAFHDAIKDAKMQLEASYDLKMLKK